MNFNTPMSSSEILKSHFEQLKKIIPEIYAPKPVIETREDKLYNLLKHSLGIIEAVYFQNREMFTLARMEEYGKVLEELNELGFDYRANKELMEKAAAAAIMSAKLPMKKAKGASAKSKPDSAKKAM